ncbi:AMP-binding protein, partial [Bacillus cereus]|nr:AMP-binding protein [Bacillus cereus]
LVEKLAPHLKTVTTYVCMSSREHMPALDLPDLHCWDELVGNQSEDFDWPEFDERTASSLCYTSGTTGKPKGAVHTHANPYWTAELYGGPVLGLGEGDICFSAAKLYFAYGLGNALSFPLSVGATVLLMAERPTPEATFARWVQHRPTVFFGAPTGFAGMLASPLLPAREQVSLRMCSSAGEALPAEIAQRFKAHFGADIVDGIGSTEMLHIFLSNRPGDIRYGTTGKPVDGYRVELRGEDGRPVADGEVGDLFIQGPSAALMYWGNRDKTRE